MTYLNKTSLLVPSQLPEYIRDNPDYQNFVLFLQAYYQWLESPDAANSINSVASSSNEGVLYASKNLLNYADIDNTLDAFIQYYLNEFMTFFPQDALVDKRKLVKIIKQIYGTKGTPASYKFLFRTIYNSEAETYNGKDYVLRASDGKWSITRSMNLSTTDQTWKSAVGYKLFGLTSKGYATIENVIIHPQYNSNPGYTEIVLTNVERNFTSGEYVTVVDVNFKPVLFSGNILQSKNYGVLLSVNVNPSYVGQNYSVGDPVVFYGGLNPSSANPNPASGYISQVTTSSVVNITPTYGGHGYRPLPFSSISITSSGGSGANAFAATFDTANSYPVSFIVTDVIGNKASIALNSTNYGFANIAISNANTTLINAFTHPIINTYGITSVTVTSGGTGYDSTTKANAIGLFADENGTSIPLTNLGILSPLVITNGGSNYKANDRITFTGGSGFGAYANITSVDANGKILTTQYIPDGSGRSTPNGGLGYQYSLPTLSITSANGTGAVLTIPGLLGGDAVLTTTQTVYGQVQNITLLSAGNDYVSAPGVSLRVQDILITGFNQFNPPMKGDVLYQGSSGNPTFTAGVDSLTLYSANTSNTYNNIYNLRVYDYNGGFDSNSSIKFFRSGTDSGIIATVSQNSVAIPTPIWSGYGIQPSYMSGVKVYGNGTAKANSNFIGGIVSGTGIYLNADGQPSGYSVLQNEKYNNYTYILEVQAALSKYKDTALSFLHPSGMNYYAVDIIDNPVQFNITGSTEELNTQKLSYLLGGITTYVANVWPVNSNIINFDSTLSGSNISNVVFANSYLTYNTTNGYQFYSKITGTTSNTITLQDSFITQVPNVAVASAGSGSNVINISSLTQAWTIATGNTPPSINSFISVSDQVSFDGINYVSVVGSNNTSNTITVNTAFGSAQSGYLTLSKNTNSSNIYISGLENITETIDLLTELGIPLTTEDLRQLLLG